MKKWMIGIIVLTCLLAVAFIAHRNFLWFQQSETSDAGTTAIKNSSLTNEVAKPTNPPTEDGYTTAVRAALGDYVTLRQTLGEYNVDRLKKEAAPLRAAREHLFVVTIPASKKDSHLVLMLALSRIEEGMSQTETSVDHAPSPLWEKGENDFDAYIKKYGSF